MPTDQTQNRDVTLNTFLTLPELAAALNVSRKTISRWRDAGLPCAVERERTIRVRLADVLAWINGNAPTKPKKRGRPKNVSRSDR